KAIENIEIKSPEKKLIVILLNEKCNLDTPFIKIVHNSEIKECFYDEVDELELKRFNSLNKLFEEKKLKNCLEYPLAWINLDENKPLDILFRKQIVDTFFSIICNRKDENNKNLYIIRGYKTIRFDSNGELRDSSSCKILGELLKFIIDEQRVNDKLIILRNTLSLYLNSEGTISDLENNLIEIKKNVNYNFNAYVQDKVKIFLNQKNKVLQECISTAKKIDELTNSLITQLKSILLSLIGTIFLGLLNDLNKGKTYAIINLVLLSYIVYFFVNWIIIFSQDKQKTALLDSFKQYILFVGIRDDDFNYDNLRDKYLKENLNIYDKYRKWALICLGVLIIIFILIYTSIRFRFWDLPIVIIKWFIGY
ncbi:hypothetical protein MGY73_002743, partial [Enterococcus faecalis]|nr:hypothetical protein [Enterococcus faecalis]